MIKTKRVPVNDLRDEKARHPSSGTPRKQGGRHPPAAKNAVSNGPRRIVDPRDLEDRRKLAAQSKKAPAAKRRVSMQPAATPNGATRQQENPHRVRRQSAPALYVTRSMQKDQMILERERRKLQDLRISQGMTNCITPDQGAVVPDPSEDPINLGARGRRVSFIPIVEELMLSPLKEEGDFSEEEE